MTLVLAAEIAPMAILGIPSGSLVQKLGSRTTMLISDFARAPILASIPLLHAMDKLSFPLLLGLVALLGCFMPPYFASQRTILPGLVGEDEKLMSQSNSMIEGRGVRRPDRPRPRRRPHSVHRRPERPLRGCGDVPRRLPSRPRVRAAQEAVRRRRPVGVSPIRFVLGDRLLGPLAAAVVATGFFGAGMSAGLPVYAYDEFDGSARIAGLFYAALGAGALVGSLVAVLAVRKVAPLRLAGFAILAFAVPLWVLPFLPPWPVVFLALFTATLFTPLVNGPLIAVTAAHARCAPGEGDHGRDLRQHTGGPARLPGGGADARALGRRPAVRRRRRDDVDGDRRRGDRAAAR